MTQKLESSIMQVNDLLLAGYRRVSKASDEIKSNLGLDPQQDIYAHLGIASVEEFIVLQSNNIQQRQSKTWNLSKIEQAVKIESVYIDAPNADAFVFEILSSFDEMLLLHTIGRFLRDELELFYRLDNLLN